MTENIKNNKKMMKSFLMSFVEEKITVEEGIKAFLNK